MISFRTCVPWGVVLLVASGVTWSLRQSGDSDPRSSHFVAANHAPAAPAGKKNERLPATPSPFAPVIEIFVQPANETRGHRRAVAASQPLRNGDKILLHVQIPEPAHLYLWWIDAAGEITSLWPTNEESPIREVWLPPLAISGKLQEWYVIGGEHGVESLLAVASQAPLSAEERTAWSSRLAPGRSLRMSLTLVEYRSLLSNQPVVERGLSENSEFVLTDTERAWKEFRTWSSTFRGTPSMVFIRHDSNSD